MTVMAAQSSAISQGATPPIFQPHSTAYLYQPVAQDEPLSLSFTGFDDPKRPLIEFGCVQLNRLLALDSGWDGRSANRVSPVAAIHALNWLYLVADSWSADPQVFPLPDGGVQLEWLANGEALELEVSPEGSLDALGVDGAGNVIVEGEFAVGSALRSVIDVKKYLAHISDQVGHTRRGF